MPSDTVRLPETVAGWKLAGPPRRIDAATIFDYMNGAGELYLSYRFERLLVSEYKNAGGDDILVEIYDMEGPGDAFGLLSLDWSGEPVELGGGGPDGASAAPSEAPSAAPSSRALYGEGLLRAWVDDLYVRVLASREGPGVKDAVLALGRAVAEGRGAPAPPDLLRALGPAGDSPWALRPDRTAYFYSHLVLNSVYYLSHENILGLGPGTEAAMATLERERPGEAKRSARLLVIGYPSAERAAEGLAGFYAAYLADEAGGKGPQGQDVVEVEDGWLGHRTEGRFLALAFQCPDAESAREVLGRAVLK